MSYGPKEMASAFRNVRKNTIQVAEDIPESSYNFSAAPDVRTVAQMLTHIAVSPLAAKELSSTPGLTTLVGYDFLALRERILAEESKPRTKAEILELLRVEGEGFASWLESLTPDFLAFEITDPDGKTNRTRLERLLGAKEHEMHHRAQLMLIQRQLGIVPHITRQFNERLAQMRAAKA
jgi:uncharacterized damage-inducible protein DinB